MKKLFGNPRQFAIGVAPLEGPPPESDASAAITWAALEIWAGGRSLSAHTHIDSEMVHVALHWPAIFFARWLVRSWPSLFERQTWPLPELDRNARDLCEELDDRAAEDVESDKKVDLRDEFMAHHSLLAAAAGGLLPDLYFAHDGDRVSIAWGKPAESLPVRFHHSRGEIDIATPLFLDAVTGFIEWIVEALSRSDASQAVSDKQEFDGWLEYIDSRSAAQANLAGFIGITNDELVAFLEGRAAENVFALPDRWYDRGSHFDASESWPAVVFRAVKPELSQDDVEELLQRLAQVDPSEVGRAQIDGLRARIPTPTGRTDFEQGYAAAEALREIIGNRDEALDIESFVRDELSVPILEDLVVDSPEIDGGSIWDADRGPAIFINSSSDRGEVDWGRRMILAHELCHLLFDVRAAIPLTVVSGPWAPPIIERRANAFAAELLIPLLGIRRLVPLDVRRVSSEQYQTLMREFGVGDTTCRNHVENRLRLRRGY